jgi:hypothetical protein
MFLEARAILRVVVAEAAVVVADLLLDEVADGYSVGHEHQVQLPFQRLWTWEPDLQWPWPRKR